jgi:hypothetical protein
VDVVNQHDLAAKSAGRVSAAARHLRVAHLVVHGMMIERSASAGAGTSHSTARKRPGVPPQPARPFGRSRRRPRPPRPLRRDSSCFVQQAVSLPGSDHRRFGQYGRTRSATVGRRRCGRARAAGQPLCQSTPRAHAPTGRAVGKYGFKRGPPGASALCRRLPQARDETSLRLINHHAVLLFQMPGPVVVEPPPGGCRITESRHP